MKVTIEKKEERVPHIRKDESINLYKIQVGEDVHEINDKKFFKTAKFEEEIESKRVSKEEDRLENQLKEDGSNMNNEAIMFETEKNLRVIEERMAKLCDNSNLSTISSIENKTQNTRIPKEYTNMNKRDLIKEVLYRDKIIQRLKKERETCMNLLKKKDNLIKMFNDKIENLKIFNQKIIREKEVLMQETKIKSMEVDKLNAKFYDIDINMISNGKEFGILEVKLKHFMEEANVLNKKIKELKAQNENLISAVEDLKADNFSLKKELQHKTQFGTRNSSNSYSPFSRSVDRTEDYKARTLPNFGRIK